MLTQRGYNLVELMVVLAISTLLINFIFELYLSGSKSSQLIHSLNQIQNNATSAIALLSTDIQQSGYIGCARLEDGFPIDNSTNYTLTPMNKISLNDHALIVRHADLQAATVLKTNQDRTFIYATTNKHFKPDNVVIIADCKHAEIIKIASISHCATMQKLFFSQPLHHEYDRTAEISRLVINEYFVTTTKRKDKRGEPIQSLYIKDIHGNKVELVEGITDFKVDSVKNGIAIDFMVEAYPIQKRWHLFKFVPQ